MSELKPTVTRDGQRYMDEAVYAMPKRAKPIDVAVAQAFNRQPPQPIVVDYNRVRLRWMKPDGKGGLVPR